MKMEKQKIKAGKKNLKAKLEATLKTVDGQETPECRDVKCHIHGTLRTRGRIFEGIVKRKFYHYPRVELSLYNSFKYSSSCPKCSMNMAFYISALRSLLSINCLESCL